VASLDLSWVRCAGLCDFGLGGVTAGPVFGCVRAPDTVEERRGPRSRIRVRAGMRMRMRMR
jgi:hypothetical protein